MSFQVQTESNHYERNDELKVTKNFSEALARTKESDPLIGTEVIDETDEKSQMVTDHHVKPQMFSEMDGKSKVPHNVLPPETINSHANQRGTPMVTTPPHTIGRSSPDGPQVVKPPDNIISESHASPQLVNTQLGHGGHVSSQMMSTPPETISSDLDPPDSSDITAATLEERPADDSDMTLDLLEDSTISPQSQVEEKMEESPSSVLIENNMIDIKPNLDMVAVYLQNCSEYFKKNPHQLKSCSRAQVDRFDTEDPTFPSGWKVKITFCIFALLS